MRETSFISNNSLVVLDWLHWSIIKLVQVTLSIPKMPLPWMKYKLFFQHFNEKLQIRLNLNLFGSFESHLHNKYKIAFQWTKIIMIIISVYNVLNIYFCGLSIYKFQSKFIFSYIYSLDVRGKPLGQAQHWSESTSLGKRTSFRTTTPNGLLVEGLKLKVRIIYMMLLRNIIALMYRYLM